MAGDMKRVQGPTPKTGSMAGTVDRKWGPTWLKWESLPSISEDGGGCIVGFVPSQEEFLQEAEKG